MRPHTMLLVLALICGAWLPRVDAAPESASNSAKHVLLVFSEARDLPANALLEQAVKEQMTRNAKSRLEFFTESLDAVHFPDPQHNRIFQDYLKNKYAGEKLDLVIIFMSRDFSLAEQLLATVLTNVPSVFVMVNDLAQPEPPAARPCTGIVQRFDVPGTIRFIFQLQPDTRRVVVVGGITRADCALLARIEEAARRMDGVNFEFWTNRPLADIGEAVKTLPGGTVVLLSTVQRDVAGRPTYTWQLAQTIAPAASVPVYVFGEGLVGSGAVGGSVVDFDDLGADAGRLALRVLAGTPVSAIPVQIKSNGVPMVDWRALQRWHIEPYQLPSNCIVRYRLPSLWSEHWKIIVFVALGFFAQGVTIAALLVQQRRQRRAEAEILKQRTELAHVTRVSMLGQLASALTHELNQPLGAILRNAEAAEIYLQAERPNLNEVRAILTDIRRDDKRAGNVIDRMRSLFKRQKLTSSRLDLAGLVEDTVAMARADAAARQVKVKVDVSPHLPEAQGDRVHVQQVLLNLIFNGMDAMNNIPKGRRALVVRAEVTRNGNLQVTVNDSGTGVPPDDAAHVFEPFFTTKSNGMGMGLAISRTIIEAHGGELWMRSNAMEGTTFTFLLPPAGADRIKPGDLPAAL